MCSKVMQLGFLVFHRGNSGHSYECQSHCKEKTAHCVKPIKFCDCKTFDTYSLNPQHLTR